MCGGSDGGVCLHECECVYVCMCGSVCLHVWLPVWLCASACLAVVCVALCVHMHACMSGTCLCDYVAVCMLKPEDNLRCGFSGSVHLVF